MANSGAKLHPDCVTTFNEFKGNSNKPTHDFLIFKLDGINIVLDHCPVIGTSAEHPDFKHKEHPAFDHMVSHLVQKGSGYAFFVLNYEVKDGHRSKVIFITYVDDNCSPKTKMTMTSSKAAVEKGCPGFGIKIQANSKEDLAYKSILEACLASK